MDQGTGMTSLLDVLGVVVAFASIMLLMSMVVTGLVQATQAAVRLRSRNLLSGVAQVIADLKPGSNALDEAREALNKPEVALVYRVKNPTAFTRKLLGPRVSYVDPKALSRALYPEPDTAEKDEVDQKREQFEHRFRTLEPELAKRFAFRVRVVTVFWSLFIAVLFQVSTPELLSELSRNDALRERIVADADELLRRAEQEIATPLEYELLAPDALLNLANRYPHLRSEISRIEGIGTDRESLIDELRFELYDVADVDSVAETYGKLLDEELGRRYEEYIDRSRANINRLSAFGIHVWPKGLDYYYGKASVSGSNNTLDSDSDRKVLQGRAIIGVILTAILLSFGAPFWFTVLREAAGLRDRLSSRALNGKSDDAGKRAGNAD